MTVNDAEFALGFCQACGETLNSDEAVICGGCRATAIGLSPRAKPLCIGVHSDGGFNPATHGDYCEDCLHHLIDSGKVRAV